MTSSREEGVRQLNTKNTIWKMTAACVIAKFVRSENKDLFEDKLKKKSWWDSVIVSLVKCPFTAANQINSIPFKNKLSALSGIVSSLFTMG